jgi:predicted acetyltransferase
LNLEIRVIAPDEYAEFMTAAARGFAWHWDEATAEQAKPDQDRSLAVFEDGKIVGTAHAFGCRMNIPGGDAATAGIDDVAVLPTHRRRGIMRMMMARQLEDFRERGEPFAALYATESLIYGRYGYGIGALEEDWSIDTRHSAYGQPFEHNGQLSFVEPDAVPDICPPILERALKDRPGSVPPTQHRWHRIAGGREGQMDYAKYFHVRYEEDGRTEGYARYTIDEGEVTVDYGGLIWATPSAHAALWRFCFDIDLTWKVKAGGLPVDDPLPWMLADTRRLSRNTHDALWIRLVDVQASLAARTYSAPGSLVIEVADPFCPWNEGRYELEAGPDGATCARTSKSPDLALNAGDLASAYLGTVPFTLLARAGRVEELAGGSQARADEMFATDLKPWCAFHF